MSEVQWTPEMLAAELIKNSQRINDDFDNSRVRDTLEGQVLLLAAQLENLSWGIGRILILLTPNAQVQRRAASADRPPIT